MNNESQELKIEKDMKKKDEREKEKNENKNDSHDACGKGEKTCRIEFDGKNSRSDFVMTKGNNLSHLELVNEDNNNNINNNNINNNNINNNINNNNINKKKNNNNSNIYYRHSSKNVNEINNEEISSYSKWANHKKKKSKQFIPYINQEKKNKKNEVNENRTEKKCSEQFISPSNNMNKKKMFIFNIADNNISGLYEMGTSQTSGESMFKNKNLDHMSFMSRLNNCFRRSSSSSEKKVPMKNKYGFSCSDYYSYSIPNNEKTTYASAQLLNNLWKTYVNELMEVLNTDCLSLKQIYEIELIGAYIEVYKSMCASYIGTIGIVLLESVNAFQLITPKDKIVTILKRKTIFKMPLKERAYYMQGIALVRDPVLKTYKISKGLQKKGCM